MVSVHDERMERAQHRLQSGSRGIDGLGVVGWGVAGVLVSDDTDFGTIPAETAATRLSLVMFRRPSGPPTAR